MYHVLKPQVTEVTHHTCDFHKRNPGAQFPGCTCSSSYSTRDKPEPEWTKDERENYYAALRGEKPDGSPLWT